MPSLNDILAVILGGGRDILVHSQMGEERRNLLLTPFPPGDACHGKGCSA